MNPETAGMVGICANFLTLAEDQSLVIYTNVGQRATAWNSSSQWPRALLWSLQALHLSAYTDTDTQIMNNNENKF